MKTALKIIGIVILVILIIVISLVVLFVIASKSPAVSEDYQNKVKTGGEIEATYIRNGSFEVAVYEEKTFQGFGKYVTYYPAELKGSSRKYPVIVCCNGTGVPISKYLAVSKHLASWGFIVIGTDEEYDWNGFSAEMCIRHLKRWNDNEKIEETNSPFYQKVDFENVGIVGHSQGGVGVINAITTQSNKDVFKAAVSLSPTNKELAFNLEWEYNAAKIAAPIMLISGAGGGDDWVVTGEQLESTYSDIGSDKIMLRRKNTPHGDMLYSANGYVTAWFMWQLQADENAAKAFVGSAPEIMSNDLYQDQQQSFGKH